MTIPDPSVIFQLQPTSEKSTQQQAQNSDNQISADDLDSPSSLRLSVHPESQQTEERGRGRAKQSRRNAESSPSPSLRRRPQFSSDWNLPRLRPRKPTDLESVPFQLDSHGRPRGLLQCGPRVRMKTK